VTLVIQPGTSIPGLDGNSGSQAHSQAVLNISTVSPALHSVSGTVGSPVILTSDGSAQSMQYLPQQHGQHIPHLQTSWLAAPPQPPPPPPPPPTLMQPLHNHMYSQVQSAGLPQPVLHDSRQQHLQQLQHLQNSFQSQTHNQYLLHQTQINTQQHVQNQFSQQLSEQVSQHLLQQLLQVQQQLQSVPQSSPPDTQLTQHLQQHHAPQVAVLQINVPELLAAAPATIPPVAQSFSMSSLVQTSIPALPPSTFSNATSAAHLSANTVAAPFPNLSAFDDQALHPRISSAVDPHAEQKLSDSELKNVPDAAITRCHLHKKPTRGCKICQRVLASLQQQQLSQEQTQIQRQKLNSDLSRYSFQCSTVLRDHVLKSSNFKGLLAINNLDALSDEIQSSTDSLDIYQAGSTTSPSPFFCSVFRIHTIEHTDEELQQLLDHPESVLARCAGFLHVRFAVRPENMWDLCEEYLLDEMDLGSFKGKMECPIRLVSTFRA
jgi:hypothetical protein